MSIADLRKSLKPTPVASLEDGDQALDKALGRTRGANNDFIKIKDGTNLLRLYPPHESKDEFGRVNPFAEPVVVAYLPGYVIEKDEKGNFIKDAAGVPKKKLSRRPVFNATIHGKKNAANLPLTKDLVEEFIKIAQKMAAVLYADEKERKKYLEPIFGVYSPVAASRVESITYTPKWAIYVDQIEGGVPVKFGRVEIGKAVKTDINSIAAVEASDEPLGTDPFTDLDEGRALKILYNSKATQASDYYTTTIDSTSVPEVLPDGRKINVLRLFPISDERLEIFANATPLAKIYRGAFTRKDFDIQLTGLKILDTANNMGIFDTPEFQIIAEDIARHYPVEEAPAEEGTSGTESHPQAEVEKPIAEPPPASPVSVEPTSVEPEPLTAKEQSLPIADSTASRVEESDMFSTMGREELEQYASDASTGIVCGEDMSDEDLRDELRIWRLENQGQFEALVEKKVVEPEPPAPEPKQPSAKERLEALKKKAQAGG